MLRSSTRACRHGWPGERDRNGWPGDGWGAHARHGTPADLERLGALSGTEAEDLFLTLMIAHHQGGVTMAKAALDRASDRSVRTLGTAIVAGQPSEIDLMRQLLSDQ